MIKNLDFKTFKQHLGKFSMFNWKTYSKISHDISEKSKQFFDELMLNQDDNGHDYDEGFLTDSLIRNNLFHTPCYNFDNKRENLFYNNSEDYEKLQNLLIDNNFKINFIISDITEFPSKLKGKFDYIFLSNIYDYVDKDVILNVIHKLYYKLKINGEIQYHYTFHSYLRSENLISKLAYLKRLESTFEDTSKINHIVYFIKKDNEKSLEF